MAGHGDMMREVWEALEKVEDLNQLEEKERQYFLELVDHIIKQGEEEIRKFDLVPDVKSASDEDVLRSLERQLTSEEILDLKYALHLETFTMSLEPRAPAAPRIARFTRGGEEFFDDIDLSKPDGNERATRMQIASILVEFILLLLFAIGIKISYNNEQMDSVIAKVNQLIDEGIVQKVHQFITAWQQASTLLGKAKAVVKLIISIFAASPAFLLRIVRALVSPLPFFRRLYLIAKIIVAIKNAIKNPRGLTAKIALALKNVPGIIEKKLLNLAALKKATRGGK